MTKILAQIYMVGRAVWWNNSQGDQKKQKRRRLYDLDRVADKEASNASQWPKFNGAFSQLASFCLCARLCTSKSCTLERMHACVATTP
jgi:hypothetical protein